MGCSKHARFAPKAGVRKFIIVLSSGPTRERAWADNPRVPSRRVLVDGSNPMPSCKFWIRSRRRANSIHCAGFGRGPVSPARACCGTSAVIAVNSRVAFGQTASGIRPGRLVAAQKRMIDRIGLETWGKLGYTIGFTARGRRRGWWAEGLTIFSVTKSATKSRGGSNRPVGFGHVVGHAGSGRVS